MALVVAAAGCSGGGGGGGDKADKDVIVGVVSGPVTEGGGQASISVVLRAKPSKDVVVPIASADEGEGTVSPPSLTFTRADWDAPQTILVTGVDDSEQDGNAGFTITLGAIESNDDGYAEIDPDDVLVTNLDDETAGVITGPASGFTTELGAVATVPVVLQSRPISDVFLIFGTSDLGEGVTDLQSLTFTPSNWDAPQIVTVTGVDDETADGTQNYSILFQSSLSEDPSYAFLPVEAVPVTNLDDESAGILVDKTSGITSELLDEETYSVQLLSRPTATVVLTWTLSDTGEATFGSTSSSTFTQQFTINNWNVAQVFTVRGDNDSLSDGDQLYTVSVTGVTSQDTLYTATTRPVINLVNVDDDIPGFLVSAPSGPTAESGESASFTVGLRAAPTTGSVDVTIGLTDSTEATVSPATLSLTSTTPVTVTVNGKLDFKRDGHQPFAVTFTPAVAADPAYSGLQIPNIGLTNIDDGPVRRALVLDDANGTHADDAADEAGYDVVLVNDAAAFDTAFDTLDDLHFIVLEATTSALPASTESRLISWIDSSGTMILSHWDLASYPALQASMEVTATQVPSPARLILPATGADPNLFTTPDSFPAPLFADEISGDMANELALVIATNGTVAARFDDATTGPGAVTITKREHVIVNGLSLDDFASVDADPGPTAGDGSPDIFELYSNEIAALQFGEPSTELRFDNNTPLATVDSGTVTSTPLDVSGGPSSIGAMRVSMYFETTDDFNDFSEITLISPSGVRVGLSIHNSSTAPNSGNSNYGLSCDDADRTIFDDSAAVSIDLPTLPPFVGPHRPMEPLSVLTGDDANGPWEIEIVNDFSTDSGTLHCWSLHFD